MLIDDVRGVRVLVVGDVILDHFVVGDVQRVSPEAPALVLRVSRERSMLGGAGNVAANIASLGGAAVLVGVVGDDRAGDHFASIVAQFGTSLRDSTLRSADYQTTEKTRYVAGNRHLLRTDVERDGLPAGLEQALATAIHSEVAGCDAVLVSDYAKGVVSPRIMRAVREAAAAHGIPLVADPKRRDFALYAGADLLTPNAKELEFATGEPCNEPASCERAAREVMSFTGASVLLTRSEHGIALYEPDGTSWQEDAQARVVRDVSGAGDTIVAAATVALGAAATLREASHFANVAAGVTVGKPGTSCVTPDELTLAMLQAPDAEALAGKLVSMSSAGAIRRAWRSQGLEVGFTNGCFDLVHPGHVRLLAEASTRCDRLIVALNTDSSVRRLKGADRPIQSELARAEVIGALRVVDLVVLFDDDTPSEMIDELRPDVLIKGADYTIDTVVGAGAVLGWGGRVELVELVPDQSSSRLIAASKGTSDAATAAEG